MAIETIEQFKNLSEHDQKEVLNLIKLKNEFKKQEIERKVKAYDELIEYLKEQINECKLTGNDEDYIKKDVYEEILYKIEKR